MTAPGEDADTTTVTTAIIPNGTTDITPNGTTDITPTEATR